MCLIFRQHFVDFQANFVRACYDIMMLNVTERRMIGFIRAAMSARRLMNSRTQLMKWPSAKLLEIPREKVRPVDFLCGILSQTPVEFVFKRWSLAMIPSMLRGGRDQFRCSVEAKIMLPDVRETSLS